MSDDIDIDDEEPPKCVTCGETCEETYTGICDIEDEGHRGFCSRCYREHNRECATAIANRIADQRFEEWKETKHTGR